jgi:chorismate-pyruvate lyase
VDSLPHTIGDLYRLFGQTAPAATVVPAEATPQPQRRLLSHEKHMTVTLEEHHGGEVDVVVLDRVVHGDSYTRKILLCRSTDEGDASPRSRARVVQFGIMLFNLQVASNEARAEILSERTPLGHILIRHRRLRRISTHSLLEIEPDAEMRRHFGLPELDVAEAPRVFGRLATIFCDEEPAVELLEVLPPGPDAVAVAPVGRA